MKKIVTNELLSPSFLRKIDGELTSKSFYIKTFGCQMNVADSDFITGCFIDSGFTLCEKPEDADIIVVNTCTVRQHAENRALSYLGRLKKLSLKTLSPQFCSPEANKTIRGDKRQKIIVVGCVASRLKDTLKKRFPFVDEIIPAYEIEKISEILKKHETTPHGFDPPSFDKSKLNGGTDAKLSEFVTISRGCSNYCSYCIVPYVRGEETSRPIKKIMLDIKNLMNSGRQEITLLGQNVNSYKSNGLDFADLLFEVNEIPEIKKISFITSHPRDMSDKIIDTIASLPKISQNIHLPVQSGSNRILKLMNRGYTRENYLFLVEKIKKKIPDVSITTDFMVGFPTETEDDFNDTLDLVREVKFKGAFTFKYSPREKTKAFELLDDVPLPLKEKRLAILNDIWQNISKVFH